MNFTNVSQPPSDCRTVMCLLANGEQVRGSYYHHADRPAWIAHRLIAETINPVGWRELEDNDQ